MNLYTRIKTLLNKPFPQEESKWEYVKLIAVISVFIVFFLYIFKPFDLDELDSHQFLISLGFGFMTFIAAILYELVFNGLLKLKSNIQSFTFGKWIPYTIGSVLVISIFNFIFARMVFFGYVKWEFLHYMIINTFTIAIFPICGLGLLALYRLEKKYETISDHINASHKSMDRESHLDRAIFDIPIYQIKYIEAFQNYVKIGFVDQQQLFKEQTERATLKSILDQAEGTALVRCHRSYIVNQDAIIHTSGNAQGLQLTLSECSKSIPVSRSYVDQFKELQL